MSKWSFQPTVFTFEGLYGTKVDETIVEASWIMLLQTSHWYSMCSVNNSKGRAHGSYVLGAEPRTKRAVSEKRIYLFQGRVLVQRPFLVASARALPLPVVNGMKCTSCWWGAKACSNIFFLEGARFFDFGWFVTDVWSLARCQRCFAPFSHLFGRRSISTYLH